MGVSCRFAMWLVTVLSIAILNVQVDARNRLSSFARGRTGGRAFGDVDDSAFDTYDEKSDSFGSGDRSMKQLQNYWDRDDGNSFRSHGFRNLDGYDRKDYGDFRNLDFEDGHSSDRFLSLDGYDRHRTDGFRSLDRSDRHSTDGFRSGHNRYSSNGFRNLDGYDRHWNRDSSSRHNQQFRDGSFQNHGNTGSNQWSKFGNAFDDQLRSHSSFHGNKRRHSLVDRDDEIPTYEENLDDGMASSWDKFDNARSHGMASSWDKFDNARGHGMASSWDNLGNARGHGMASSWDQFDSARGHGMASSWDQFDSARGQGMSLGWGASSAYNELPMVERNNNGYDSSSHLGSAHKRDGRIFASFRDNLKMRGGMDRLADFHIHDSRMVTRPTHAVSNMVMQPRLGWTSVHAPASSHNLFNDFGHGSNVLVQHAPEIFVREETPVVDQFGSLTWAGWEELRDDHDLVERLQVTVPPRVYETVPDFTSRPVLTSRAVVVKH